MARCTFPLRRHLVQTIILRGVPLIMALTLCRLGAQTFLVRMWEWLTFIPTATPLPQISHLLAKVYTSFSQHFYILSDLRKRRNKSMILPRN
jgi:hypothetical protein